MIREIPEEELKSVYTAQDLVKADCGGCDGCHLCCTGMGDSIVLDPYDAYRLTKGLQTSMEALSGREISWKYMDGMIRPYLNMAGTEEACVFLNEEGRCRIHSMRPGLCRMFPLGRVYEGDSFRYYLQLSECPKAGRIKVKVKKWLDQPELSRYERFILRWHFFGKQLEEKFAENQDEKLRSDLCGYLLKLFYLTPFEESGDFFAAFEERLEKAEKLIRTIDWT